MKPKVNRAGDKDTSSGFDRCNTPSYALDPLIPFLKPDWIVWEPMAGTGNLVRAIQPHTACIIGTELQEDTPDYIVGGVNFFSWKPDYFSAIVTNPAYSIKFDVIKRCYELQKPFALLVPLETIGAWAAQKYMELYGFELMLLTQRVDFEMPNKGYDGNGAQFPVMWFCHNILPKQVMIGRMNKPKKVRKPQISKLEPIKPKTTDELPLQEELYNLMSELRRRGVIEHD